MPGNQRDRHHGKKLNPAEALPFHLALRLGFPHPDYLLPHLSAKQLLDWQRYAGQFGLGVDRDDIHWGMLLSMYYNTNRAKDSPPKTATEFMPYREEEEETQEEFIERIRGLACR